MQFNRMEPYPDEDLNHFYSRLVEQADKCGFQCNNCDSSYQQRMIRDRLILFADKYLCDEIFDENPNPTVEYILCKYDEDHKFRKSPVWPHILSYLPLHDLHVFSLSHPKLKEIVHSYLDNGHPLLIDSDTLWKYPVSSHGEFYAAYGSRATNVVLNRAFPFELPMIFQRFLRILQLTLIKIDYEYEYEIATDSYPTEVRKLILIENDLSFSVSEKWLPRLHSLESLHLKDNKNVLLGHFPTITSLSLTRRHIIRPRLICPLLKSLTLECWGLVEYATIQAMKDLQYLRILRSVDWKDRKEVEALGLQSLDVSYQAIPEEADLIFRLNDDCLLHMMKFLDNKDRITLHNTHTRFSIAKFQWYCLDLECLPLGENPTFYEWIGSRVSRLIVCKASIEDLKKLIPTFTNAREIEFSWDFQVNENIEPLIPTGVTNLRIYLNAFNTYQDWLGLFGRLNVTLKRLILPRPAAENTSIVSALTELRNIQHFSLSCNSIRTKTLCPFLKLNQLSMLTLDITINDSCVWQVIGQMRILKELTVTSYVVPGALADLDKSALPELEVLSIKNVCAEEPRGRDFLKSLNGSKLRKLYYDGYPFDIRGVIDGRMKNLEELSLVDDDTWHVHEGTLALLSNLRVLQLQNMEDNKVVPLIKGLPHLHELNIFEDIADEAFLETRDYLKQTNRKFKLQSFMIG